MDDIKRRKKSSQLASEHRSPGPRPTGGRPQAPLSPSLPLASEFRSPEPVLPLASESRSRYRGRSVPAAALPPPQRRDSPRPPASARLPPQRPAKPAVRPVSPAETRRVPPAESLPQKQLSDEQKEALKKLGAPRMPPVSLKGAGAGPRKRSSVEEDPSYDEPKPSRGKTLRQV